MSARKKQDIAAWMQNGGRLTICPPDPRIEIGHEIRNLDRLYTQATMVYNIGNGCHHFKKSSGSE